MLIREATEDDNDALNELQRKCPMGTSFVLGVDSSPDYFARSRPFKDWHVFAAVENSTIVGSAAFAIKDVCVGDRQTKTAYEYGFIVDPLHRRRGIAKRLQRHIEQIALDNDVDLLHLDIIEDNTLSINLFSQMGFEKIKDCTTFSLMPYKKQEIASEANVRSMDETDVDAVTDLINETYRNYDFFATIQPNDLIQSLSRTPHFDVHNILLLEDNNGIKACLGYWEYNKVRRYIVEKLDWKLNMQMRLMRVISAFAKMPHTLKLGEPLLSYNLIIMAYRNTEHLAELIKTVVNTALQNRINFIHVTVDAKDPMAATFSQFTHTKMKLHFFMKSLKQTRWPNLGEKKLFIDAFEM